MTLRSERLLLRPWQPRDRSRLVMYANNRRVSINLRDRFPFPYTAADADEWISVAGSQTPVCNFAIEFEGCAVGGISLMGGSDIFRCSAEIGYWLGEPHWGKGIATEAVKLGTEYGFGELGLVRIYAGVFETNPASARVLEKNGYVLEARMKKAIIKEGKILDQLSCVRVS